MASHAHEDHEHDGTEKEEKSVRYQGLERK
jgi:hypothetical protein